MNYSTPPQMASINKSVLTRSYVNELIMNCYFIVLLVFIVWPTGIPQAKIPYIHPSGDNHLTSLIKSFVSTTQYCAEFEAGTMYKWGFNFANLVQYVIRITR